MDSPPVRDNRTRTKRLVLLAASFFTLALAMTSSIGPISPDAKALATVQAQNALRAKPGASPTAQQLQVLRDAGLVKTAPTNASVTSGGAGAPGTPPPARTAPGGTGAPHPPPPPPPTAAPGPGGPIRAAFYYPWYPENWHQSATQGGPDPWSHFTPSLGLYDSSNAAVIKNHIAAMQYGGIQAGISSWWGQGLSTDKRVPALLSAARGTGFLWSLYYEPALSAAGVRSDLAYINQHYGSDPNYLRVNGKPVVFVYGRSVTNCADVATWVDNNQGDYLNLQIFQGVKSCNPQPDSWHFYGPSYRALVGNPYNFTISPGFYKATEASPRLSRDPAAFATACQQMVASKAMWQLVTTFNEYGEGTQVESSAEYASPSGYGAYLDVLHNCR